MSRSSSPRRYPTHPIACVGAVVVTRDEAVVLVRRRHDPLAARWTLPGGAVELGETVRAAVAREVLEETALTVDVGPLIEVVDHVEADDAGRVRYHFVIADYLCRPTGGVAAPGTDVDELALVPHLAFESYQLSDRVEAVIEQALALRAGWPGEV